MYNPRIKNGKTGYIEVKTPKAYNKLKNDENGNKILTNPKKNRIEQEGQRTFQLYCYKNKSKIYSCLKNSDNR